VGVVLVSVGAILVRCSTDWWLLEYCSDWCGSGLTVCCRIL
jgi:hypothetical protein